MITARPHPVVHRGRRSSAAEIKDAASQVLGEAGPAAVAPGNLLFLDDTETREVGAGGFFKEGEGFNCRLIFQTLDCVCVCVFV